jgi:hypothetical protein
VHDALREARRRRWWLDRPPITTRRRAQSFIDDVGFALLFPKRGAELPTLWALVQDPDPAPDAPGAGEGWGPDIQRLWAWKDELPTVGAAWYGRFVAGQQSFLSPARLRQLYPGAGGVEDYRAEDMSADARRLCDALRDGGPTPRRVLRQLCGMDGKAGRARYDKAVGELGHRLLVTHFGVESEGGGWPSAVVELTARAFPVGPAASAARADRAPARRPPDPAPAALSFLDTMVAATAKELTRAFGWPVALARQTLDGLVDAGAAERDADLYRPAPARRS